MMSADSLSAVAVASLPDPRSKQGVSHPYHGMLILVLLGLIAQENRGELEKDD